jgi:hypothetical protein
MLALTVAAAAPAAAELKMDASANTQYQYNSNVFDLPGRVVVPGTTDFQHSDSFVSYGAQLQVQDISTQQDWYATVIGNEFRYNHFTELTHDEYRLEGRWKWRPTTRLTSTLQVSRARIMVPFSELTQLQSQIANSTEQLERANVLYQFMPRWSVEGAAFTHTFREPLQNAPDLKLTETQGGATLNYLGAVGFTMGVSASYLRGHFSNGTFDLNYDQTTYGLVAKYVSSRQSSVAVANAAEARTTMDAALSYTNRTSVNNLNNVSGFTGNLHYVSQLTGKTSVDVTLERSVSSFLSNTGSQIYGAASLKLLWQVTYKIGLAAGYVWGEYDYPNQGLLPGSDRIDHVQSVTLDANYQVRRWLILKPYARVQTRSTNFPGYSFNSTVYGIQFILQSKEY